MPHGLRPQPRCGPSLRRWIEGRIVFLVVIARSEATKQSSFFPVAGGGASRSRSSGGAFRGPLARQVGGGFPRPRPPPYPPAVSGRALLPLERKSTEAQD